MNLKDWIKTCEGYHSHPKPNLLGKVTIGFGRDINSNGISQEESEWLFDNDFERCEKEIESFSWYDDQPQNVQDALMNMCFSLGIRGLLSFVKMIDALNKKDYTKAAIEVLDSQWAKQVGQRAQDVAVMIRQG
jgi:lysozyme